MSTQSDLRPGVGLVAAPEPVPDLDWDPDTARAFGDGVLDIWQELLTGLRDRAVGRDEGPRQVAAAVWRDIPDEPVPPAALLDHLRSVALEHSMYPGHPGFMAYISGAGTVPGAPADLLAAALNQNVGGWMLSPAATEIESGVIRWLAHELGLGDAAGGTMTSGGAAATLTALKAARDHKVGVEVRRAGLAGTRPFTIYASAEAHVVIDRAADTLGLGTDAVRKVPTDAGYRMDVAALQGMIAEDREQGARPIAVVGTAGTTATGAIDPLDELANICAAEDLWFHVDGAYGAPAALVPELRPLFAGIERADSVALDPHKWLSVPLAVGCVLVRDRATLHESFAVEASYVHQDRDHVDRGEDFGFQGIQFSRGFNALKVWVSLLAHGRDAYVRRIAHDVELARYLHERAREHPALEPIGDVTLSIACFRYVPPALPISRDAAEAYLSELNERIMTAVQTDGRAFCSNAVLDGHFVLRACIVNFRTEAEDLERLIATVVELGDRLDHELRPAPEAVRHG
jgi:glutamate/tyrosine decarboxylase-like PLP-dependent enzyme